MDKMTTKRTNFWQCTKYLELRINASECEPIVDPPAIPPSPSHLILAKVLIMRSCSPSFRCSAVAVFLIMIAFIIYSARQRNYMPELGHVWWKRVGEVAEEGEWDLVWGEAVAVPTSSPFDRNSRPRAQPIFKWARSIWPSALILGWV